MVIEPMTVPSAVGACQSGLPVAPVSTHTLPVCVEVLVPSTTSVAPVPPTSARAGLDVVAPSRTVDQATLQSVSRAMTRSESEAPPK